MKVLFPKNIQKGILSGMSFSIGPLNIGIIQIVLLAVGAGLALVTFNTISKQGGKVIGGFFAVVVLGIFLVIAFFKVSEMGLLAFIAKMVRNNFFDTNKKYQNNFVKNNKTDILIKELKEKSKDGEVIVQAKARTFDSKKVENIENDGFI